MVSIHLLNLFHFPSSLASGGKTAPASNSPTQHSSQSSWPQFPDCKGAQLLWDCSPCARHLGCPSSSLPGEVVTGQNTDYGWHWFIQPFVQSSSHWRKGSRRWEALGATTGAAQKPRVGEGNQSLGGAERGEGCELRWWRSCRQGWHILCSSYNALITPHAAIPPALLPWVGWWLARGIAPLLLLCNSISATAGKPWDK